MLRLVKIAIFFYLLINNYVQATIIHVPSDYVAIQTAIDSSGTGDTVLVAPGSYLENLSIANHIIFLTSNYTFSRDQSDIENTAINGNWYDRVIEISGSNTRVTVNGFSIENGLTPYSGGGIFVNQSRVAISNNIIRYNECDGDGGGIHIVGGLDTVTIDHNTIIYNRSRGSNGGGISGYHSSVKIENNLIIQNFALK